MSRALVLMLGVGCIDPTLVICDDGLACPPRLACDVAHHSCVSPEQIDACDGLADGALCLTGGVCHEGVCLSIACGNGRLDPGEVCDDGNTIRGDGCSADCRSTEVCGNGVLDSGEQCDDGNLASHDGCDSRCVAESPVWREAIQVAAPTLGGSAVAYDEQRHRAVVFGGFDDTLGQPSFTYEWDGNAWLRPTPPYQPSFRYRTAMAYDPIRHQTVLFGGNDLNGPLADTWLWDGRRWSEAPTASPPPRRDGHVLAWDGARGVIVMFGGRGATSVLGDTWSWNGTAWVELSPASSPPARERSAMASDPAHGTLVLVGGQDDGGLTFDDTWTWDGATWTDRAAPSHSRAGAAMVYAPTLGAMVLTGGALDLMTTDAGWVYTWTGSGAWVAHDPQTKTGARRDHITFFDPPRGEVIIAGHTLEASGMPAEVEAWDGTTFATVTSTAGPSVDAGRPCFDRRRGRLVLVGAGGTWELDGGSWTIRTSSGPPAPDTNASAYDASRGRCVFYANTASDGTTPGDVWEWDGTSWDQHVAPAGPASRAGAMLAYDEVRARTMLFGGSPSPGTETDDVWLWDGTTWTDASTSPTPPARFSGGMVYDPLGHRVVLFGGGHGGGSGAQPVLDDTWIWDGAWTEVTPETTISPPARFESALSFDRRLGMAVLYGGTSASSGALNDLWTWDGAAWHHLHTEPGLDPGFGRFSSALTYDELTAESVLVTKRGEFRLRWESGALDDLCDLAIDLDGDHLAGCADPDCGPGCATCGDGICGPLESCGACPADCACTSRCGDDVCGAGEACPADCR